MKSVLVFYLLLLFIYTGCDKGIEPLPEIPAEQKAGFSGTITFTGEWPDSAKRTHLVVFENPLLSAADFNILNLKYISNEIPFGSTTFNFNSTDSSIVSIKEGTYKYVAVAQSATPQVVLERSAWYVIGVYYNEGDTTKPGTLVIPEKTLVKNININCDFNNLPPQPPGGE